MRALSIHSYRFLGGGGIALSSVIGFASVLPSLNSRPTDILQRAQYFSKPNVWHAHDDDGYVFTAPFVLQSPLYARHASVAEW